MIYDSTDDEIELDPFNGYEYVDLGLPSGTLWAKCNVGAETETDFGLYFAWGETVGYSAATSTKQFSWSDYKWGTDTAISKYNSTDGKTVLELEDDAARVNMCGGWYMPTLTQANELISGCNWTSVTDYYSTGVNGLLATSRTNSNTIFFPCAADYRNGVLGDVGGQLFSWLQNKGTDNTSARCMYCYRGATYMSINAESGGARCYGRTVRGVINL